MSKKVYLAPSAFCAFIDRAHTKHDQAVAFFRFFAQEEYQLFTDSINMVQAYNTIYKDISPSLAKDFLRSVSLGSINTLHPDESDTKAALKTLTLYRSTDLTYPEAVMAVIANRNRIPQICTFSYLHNLFGLSLFYLPI